MQKKRMQFRLSELQNSQQTDQKQQTFFSKIPPMKQFRKTKFGTVSRKDDSNNFFDDQKTQRKKRESPNLRAMKQLRSISQTDDLNQNLKKQTLALLKNTLTPQKYNISKRLMENERRQTNSPLKQQKMLSETQQDAQSPFFEYILRYSTRSQKGFMQSNPHKPNQDNFVVYSHIQRRSYQHCFAVFDGHGNCGHLISSLLKQNLPILINSRRAMLENHPNQTLNEIFDSLNNKVVNCKNFDSTFSGSTAVVLYMYHNKIYCANAGDSRAIVGTDNGNEWVSKTLSRCYSRDHKPSVEEEAKRIREQGGRIEPYQDDNYSFIGPQRVWLQYENLPGLAMTRSIGDVLAKSVGVISEPEIMEYTLTSQDKIIIIGSDGLFEFFTNDEIVNIVSDYYDDSEIEKASDMLLNKALKAWQSKSHVIDDITFLLFFIYY